jgi:23S rRNA pseudouridine2605 synthase
MSESSMSSTRVRLQKFLSDAGVASRRAAEELVRDGHVLVNDQIVDTLPAFVDPRHDRVVVNGAPVRAERHVYFLVHKPKGVVCTDRDPAGRMRVVDLLPPIKARLFIVGRLDASSTGLLLMTNDGELAERVTHPRYGVPKVYSAQVRGRVPDDLPTRMKAGVYLSEGKAQASSVQVTHRGRDASMLKITLREGRNRQIRRMLARLGHRVKALKRLAIGPLMVKGLPPGAARPLTPRELVSLRRAVEADTPRARGRHRRGRPAVRKPARAKRGNGQPRSGTTPARAVRTGAGSRGTRPRRIVP